MSDLTDREHRLLDPSQLKDSRRKGPGIHVSDNNWGRCTADLSESIARVSTARGGANPYPYGLYFLNGDAAALQDPPKELVEGPFLEVIPCDREDRRAIKLTWNETGTEAAFSFALLGAMLGIDPPKGATIWFDSYLAADATGKPVIGLPLGDRIKRQAVREIAAGQQGDGVKKAAGDGKATT
jgi:hypothetical protein